MTVGFSSRTPLKHFILNAALGQVVGALSTGRSYAKLPLLVVDLCAGDGLNHMGDQCSPRIIQKHINFHRLNGRAEAILIEKSRNIFSSLKNQLPDNNNIQLINGDAKDFVLPSLSHKQAVFIHIDPNSLADWPVGSGLIQTLNETTTFVATLGCNVGGLKRLDFFKHRAQWYDHINELTSDIPSWHDVQIHVLNRDKAQWAYVVRIPKKWSEKAMYNITKKGNELWPNGLSSASLNQDRPYFEELIDRLFLTAKELKRYGY